MHEACNCKFAGLFDQAEERFVSLLAKVSSGHAEVKNKVSSLSARFDNATKTKKGGLADVYDACNVCEKPR